MCYVVALFAKIMMGFFQVESMAIIIIRSQAASLEVSQRSEKILRAVVLLINATAFVAMVVEAIFFVQALN